MKEWTGLGYSNSIFGSERARELLVKNDLAGLDAVFAQSPQSPPRHARRTVWEVALLGEFGQPLRAFVKMSWGRRRLWPRMRDLKAGQPFKTNPEREWSGIGRLAELGLHVPERLALYRDRLFSARSAIIVGAVPAPSSVDELIDNGCWSRLDDEARLGILDGMVSTIDTIHAAGLGWRGISSRHFYPHETNGRREMWIIDCEGVHRNITKSAAQRQYAKLWRSMQESGADQVTLEALQQRIDRALRRR